MSNDLVPDGGKWVDILIRAENPEQLDEYVTLLCDIMNFTGGWVGSYSDEDNEVLDDLEVRLISCRATVEELQAIWDRVRGGQSAKEAWTVVAGPSFQHYTRRH